MNESDSEFHGDQGLLTKRKAAMEEIKRPQDRDPDGYLLEQQESEACINPKCKTRVVVVETSLICNKLDASEEVRVGKTAVCHNPACNGVFVKLTHELAGKSWKFGSCDVTLIHNGPLHVMRRLPFKKSRNPKGQL